MSQPATTSLNMLSEVSEKTKRMEQTTSKKVKYLMRENKQLKEQCADL